MADATLQTTNSRNEGKRDFRFFDNRQKYLLFVNTTSEKQIVASQVSQQLEKIVPHPPALRIFDAGVGDGSVLTRVMKAAHNQYPHVPFFIAGKEISLEDVRLALAKLSDRLYEHPETVFVLTNLNYSNAPWLAFPQNAATAIWHEVSLKGSDAHAFDTQIAQLEPFLANAWATGVSPSTGNPSYKQPVVLVLYREDHKFILDASIPRRETPKADYDLVIASQPFRARASLDFKVKRVLVPLTKALGPGGRLVSIQSHGDDPAHEIVRKVWPGDTPFIHDRHMLIDGIKRELADEASNFIFDDISDDQALFKYTMHTLPSEVEGSIGTSTAFAAWNAAVYVAQVEDQRLAQVAHDSRYLDATAEVLKKHGGLWFWDERYVISRR